MGMIFLIFCISPHRGNYSVKNSSYCDELTITLQFKILYRKAGPIESVAFLKPQHEAS